MTKRELFTRPLLMGALAASSVGGCTDDTAKVGGQELVDQMSANLKVSLTIIDNAPTDCPPKASYGLCFKAKLVLTNTSTTNRDSHFAIYYSSIRKVIDWQGDDVTFTHING